MVRDTRAGLAFFLASVGLHLIAAMAIWNVPRLPGVDPSAVEVDLWTGAPPAPGEPPGIERRGVAPLMRGGRPQAQNLDAPHRGARGDGRSEGMVVLLMPRADGVTLSDTARSSLDQSQLSRIRTARDRATQEEEFSLELRTRDRERKLIRKIDATIEKIVQDDYGFCDSCGIEIGIRRLEARPTASKCIDCKTLDEIKEKQWGA